MGNAIITFRDLRKLPNYAELLATEFTVTRTNGEEEQGWRMEAQAHTWPCGTQDWWFSKAAPSRGSVYGWKVCLVNGKENAVEHVCGWRRVGTFWPQGMDSSDARHAWCEALAKQIEALPMEKSPSLQAAVENEAADALEGAAAEPTAEPMNRA